MKRAEYERHIASAEWARKRQARLALDGHRCRMCDEDGTRFQLEVHHRPSSYRRIPNESVQDDLVTVCARCHELITSAIRGDRYARKPVSPATVIATVQVRTMEQQSGMANTEISIDILLPNDPPQRTDGEPAKQIRPGVEEGFGQAQQNRR